MRQRPTFGQNIDQGGPQPIIDEGRFNRLLDALERISETMSIIIREVAGVSITKITDEIKVHPVEIIGIEDVLVRIETTPQTRAGQRYLIGVKLDRGATVEILTLEEATFTQQEIDDGMDRTFPFVVSMLQEVQVFTVEAFVDESVASIYVQPPDVTVGITASIDIKMDTSPKGLAGYSLSFSFLDSAIAKITDVMFNPAFPLHSHSPDPVDGPSVTIQAADLSDVVQGRQTGVVLATVRAEALAAGGTAIELVINSVDDDDGFAVPHTIVVEPLTVLP